MLQLNQASSSGRAERFLRLLLVMVVAAIGQSACADVFSNVYFWSRGLATDTNGNGQVDAGEGRDSLNGENFSFIVRNGPILYTNQWAHLPYRGTTNYVQALYLPQTVVITNAARMADTEDTTKTAVGYGYPCTISIPNSRIPALTRQESANYTIYIRFRPDADVPHTKYNWLANFGVTSSKRGLMIGFMDVTTKTNTWKFWSGDTSQHSYPFTRGQLAIYYGGAYWRPGGDISLGVWNDLVLSVDGRKMRLFVSRDGYVDGFENNYGNSSLGVWHSYYYETTVGEAYDLRPDGTDAEFRIGNEWKPNGVNTYYMPKSENGNLWKSFRGAVQTVALWTNALTEAEMRQAVAWPRMDKWRLGIEDGKADEFKAAANNAVVDVEGDTWSVPALGANESMTIRFPLDASGDAKMNQYVRIKGVTGGTRATLKVAVNGTDCEYPKTVRPDRFTRWFVPADLLRANATNTLMVTRLDGEGRPFQMDVAAFGGSTQYCEENDFFFENSGEGKYQNKDYYDLIGANWFDSSRALYGYGGSGYYACSFTNQVIRFSLPQDMKDLGLDYKLTLRTCNHDFPLSIVFNGEVLVDAAHAFGGEGLSLDVPARLFKEVNEVKVVSQEKFVNGKYYGIDFLRLSVQPPRPVGLMIKIR